ncbi:TetR family transcriptional regulator [Paraconexibacter algicola]|uniref:TetR family transcriptional regulator n=1 Tax=Paraconexibacter algicola TaxID=2133960 RepID=A0A2T4UMB8_9ACTN|nr:TetR family transcriptional regulator [Paraconexibacter algicola]PTL60385.1 TetR family transcriptional regulator [Paraconexibacter algicola]
MDEDQPAPGLRERKKLRTRQAISDIATELFARRGFEAVTVAEIAAAAEVSVGTVFNYFPAKEDLFFDRADELLDRLRTTIEERPCGQTILGAVDALLRPTVAPVPGFTWAALEDPEMSRRFVAFRRTLAGSPALRARRLVIAEDWTAALQETIARDLGLRPDDPRAVGLAATLGAALDARERTLGQAVLAGRAPRTVRRQVHAVMDETFGRAARAFADVDRPRP